MGSNKNLVYALAGVGALVGAALIYSWVTDADNEEGAEGQEDLSELLQEKGLDDVKKNEYGMLDAKYFLELLQFVGEEMRRRQKSSKKKLN